MILDNANLPPVIETAPYMLADGGALDVDNCPDCWERRAHIERYVWAARVCKRMRVLDFGCGTGYGSEILLAKGRNSVVGVDRSAEAIHLARLLRGFNGSWRITYLSDRAEYADLPPFDACVAFEVLEHLDDPAEFIRTVRARHLIASVPVRDSKICPECEGTGITTTDPTDTPYRKRTGAAIQCRCDLNGHKGFVADDNPHHKQHFTVESFKSLVETRFRIVSWWLQIEPYHNYPSVVVVHGEEKR